MKRLRQTLLTILCLLALLPVARVAAQVEEPQPLPAVEAPPPPRPAQQPARQPTPPRNAAATPATAVAPDALTAGEAQRLLQLLQDDAQRAELLRTLRALTAATGGAAPAPTGAAPAPAPGTAPPAATPTPPAAATAPAEGQAAATPPAEAILAPNTLGAQLLQGASQRLSALSEQMVTTVRAIADLPSVVAWFSAMARDPVTQYRVKDAAWKLILVLGLGLLCEWAVSRALTRARDRLDSLAPEEGVAYSWLRKIPLVIARLGLDLLPIAAFAVVSYGLIGAVQPVVTTELVMLTMNNAYMASRAVMVASRMLLSPASPMLRLLPVADETAAYITIWLRRITVVVVVGYAVAEAGLQFGLPWSAYDSILRVCMLLVTMFLVIVILQNRTAVSDVLHAGPLPEGVEPEPTRRMLRAMRDRAAEIWHFIAIAWLIAAWGVWALEVQGGFWRLIRVSLMTLVVLGGARLVDMGVRRLIQRAFRITPDLARRYPGLEPRANRYLPVLKGAFSFFITGIALLLLLEIWGIESFSWFGQGKLGSRLVGSIASMGLTILVAMTAWEAANAAIERHLSRLSRDAKAARSARVRTLLPMLRTALMVTILVIVSFIFLTEIGVNVAPLIAGAGVVGIAIGFGSQTLVRDVITGIFLLFEDAMAVGDVVQVGGLGGVVEQLSIRSIKLRALDGSLHIIPFSAVTTVTNQTRDFAFAVIEVSVAYGQDTDRVLEVLKEIAKELREDVKWRPVIRDDLDIQGVERFLDLGVVIRVRLKTDPSQRWGVAREMNRRINKKFDELGIESPAQYQKLLLEKPDVRPPAAEAAPAAATE